ncbi:methylamine dehydrogenase accessory protein MauD [Methylobacillus rhizosphaerae]|uniref:Methylamine utilization protein MauD n=1 Tax=Methylobacillus rhizosphaerae TaxID=551994 RepID=A0A238Z7U7_9PROT|nr:methylamine dehydrogenase accessory protein MauD [Methylobacillus rhizosphaerae]SNR79536.1 methylamine dehydrogenase accessory protein MauD [Methylobacillus rhizosphaerae]
MNTGLLIASNVLLWGAFLALAALMLGVIRQIGLLHERSAPLGAMMIDHGPDIGEKSPVFSLTTIDGAPVTVGRAVTPGRASLLMFTGPSCPICQKLLPIIRSVAATENTDVILISDGTQAEHREFLRNHPLDGERYVVSAEIGMRYQVSKVPYGVLLDSDGVIQAKGLCNTREHVESLFETTRMGHATLQNFLKHGAEDASKHVH